MHYKEALILLKMIMEISINLTNLLFLHLYLQWHRPHNHQAGYGLAQGWQNIAHLYPHLPSVAPECSKFLSVVDGFLR